MKITAYSQPLRPAFKSQIDENSLNEYQKHEFRNFKLSNDTEKIEALKKDTLILKAKNDDLAKQNEKIILQNIQLKHALFQIATAMNLEFQNPEAAKEAKFASYRVRD